MLLSLLFLIKITYQCVCKIEPVQQTTNNPIITTNNPIITTNNPTITTKSPIITTNRPIITTNSPIITSITPSITSTITSTTIQSITSTVKSITTQAVTNIVFGEFERNCLSLLNNRRNLTNASPLVWNFDLQVKSKIGSDFCSNIFEHNTLNDINAQILASPPTCNESIILWYDNEIIDNGEHFLIIKNNILKSVGCAFSTGGNNTFGGSCLVCDFLI